MSRGGRGGARGGGRRNKGAPEMEDFDDDDDLTPRQKKPQSLFPDISLPVPRPPAARELSALKHYLSFRKRVRNGPYFATLDPSSIADERTGKTLKRAGFDPFNDQETFSSKNHKKKRDVPDLKGAGREYALKFFPRELWPILDPKGKNPLSHAPSPSTEPSSSKHKSLKRKRDTTLPTFSDDDTPMKDADAAEDEEATQTDSSDALIPSGRRARTISKAAKKKRRGRDRTNGSREKRGLDAEDDFDTGKKTGPSPPSTMRAKEKKRKKAEARAAGRKVDDTEDEDEDDENEVPNEDDGGDEDEDDDDEEPVDSEYEESDEGDKDDYNAEGYFDDGDRDDEDGLGFGGGGGDEGGEY